VALIECDLLIVDDVDGGLPTGRARHFHHRPGIRGGAQGGDGRRPGRVGRQTHGLVLGNTTTVAEWRCDRPPDGRLEDEIMTIQLQPAPPQPWIAGRADISSRTA